MRPRTPSRSSVPRERSSGQKRSHARRSDLDPVVLLRHREVTAPEPGLDVRERHGRVGCRARARERRVRVSVDEDEVGRLLGDPGRNRRPHLRRIRRVEVEAVARLGDAELVEEDLGHHVEPVLAGVQDDLVDPGVAQRERERCGLDELRPVPDDGEDLHRASNTTSLPGDRRRGEHGRWGSIAAHVTVLPSAAR